ncbi:threonine synthase [Thermomicrobium sp. 4228-Ro]|uniref:threonine synthase n=1 Tax=Thermomicrobium sp. 4228-Ro TaxID=2993937 RepID=UPI0022493347|nr:threonine synthase [Thermomicrobium sp. 4228-Ro]MCX2727479.1 threonine synthase [Thermomicrobium sp. 4228-Ro]
MAGEGDRERSSALVAGLAGISLRCGRCGTAIAADRSPGRCGCGGLYEVVYTRAPAIDLRAFERRLGSWEALDRSGVWRYRELLPPLPSERIVTRPEGNTNLYSHPALSAWTGCTNLIVKHEGENPTGSFKDRGMTVAISHARAVGARAVACASTGNTSASVAAYAALAGLPSVVFLPAGKIAAGKLGQAIAYGARIVQVEGDFDAAMQLVEAASSELDLYLLNSVNPFRLEGQKTIVFELLHQLAWEPPDWIVLPGGNLGNTAAFGAALEQLVRWGLVAQLPRLAVIQAEGAAPFYAAYRSGFVELRPVRAETVATAIRIGNPVSYERARRAIEFTRGVVEIVSDEEILDAKAVVDRAGIGCEPASAASVAGVRKLVAQGVIRPGDRVVAVLTGHVLKDPDAIIAYHLAGERRPLANRPVTIPPSLAALREVLDDAG